MKSNLWAEVYILGKRKITFLPSVKFLIDHKSQKEIFNSNLQQVVNTLIVILKMKCKGDIPQVK